MKTDPTAPLRLAWSLLTEVPGWTDAPVSRRLRQALPIVLPAFAALVLVGWQLLWHQARVQSAREQHVELLALENEVAQLNVAFSEQRTQELDEAEAALLRTLPRQPADARVALEALEREAAQLGWSGVFRLGNLPDEETTEPLLTVPARARLTPSADLGDPLPKLLSLLERIRTNPRRIELMRLSISADESHWHSVELGLRLVLPSPHAQVPQ